MKQRRDRILSAKHRKWIVVMRKSGDWKGVELAEIFGVTRSRISQICSNYYGDQEGLGLGEEFPLL